MVVLRHRHAGILRWNSSSISAAARLNEHQHSVVSTMTPDSPFGLGKEEPEVGADGCRRRAKDKTRTNIERYKQRWDGEAALSGGKRSEWDTNQVMIPQSAAKKRLNDPVLTKGISIGKASSVAHFSAAPREAQQP